MRLTSSETVTHITRLEGYSNLYVLRPLGRQNSGLGTFLQKPSVLLGDGFDCPDQTAHRAHWFVQCPRESQRCAAIGDRIMDQSVRRPVEPMQPGRSQYVLLSVAKLLEILGSGGTFQS